MRLLFTTRGSAGHLLPLVPFARAAQDAGHEVLLTTQRQHAANAARTGLPYAELADPPRERWMPQLMAMADAGLDAANTLMLQLFFADVDTRATLGDLRALADDWRPDVIVRESWELASAFVAEERGIPLARVALGSAAMEELSTRLAAPALDAIRADEGLARDPDGDRIRATPYLTTTPAVLEDPAAPVPPHTTRLRYPAGTRHAPADGPPLVYVTFGSVAPTPGHMRYFPAMYDAVLERLAALDVRIVLTVGSEADPAALGPQPANVRVERWVPQDEILEHAAVVVGHGGHGTTFGALAHSVPVVSLPLFSIDQWDNAAAVARAGAGLALDDERHTRTVLGLPGEATLAQLALAVQRVLDEPAFTAGAQRVAAAMAALPPVEHAVGVLEGLAAQPAARA